MRLKLLKKSFIAATVIAVGVSAHAADKAAPSKRKAVTLRVAMRDGLRFDPPRLKVNPGDEVTINLENADSTHQMHNFLVVRPGTRGDVVTQALGMGETGPAKQFVPESPAILAHSDLLAPDKTQSLTFTMPDEAGVYPYVCTFPGHGLVMYGAIYAGVPMPPLHEDTHLPSMLTQGLISGGGRRPFVQRIFMPEAGPASIAVALPGEQNFCWDAGPCRLRYAWSGTFIDASEHWRGNGSALARLPAQPWWKTSPEVPALRFGKETAEPPVVTFLGYRLEAGIPEFRYRADEVEVREKITASTTGRQLSIRYRLQGAKQPVFVPLPSAQGCVWSASAGEVVADHLRLKPEQATEFTLTLSAAHEK